MSLTIYISLIKIAEEVKIKKLVLQFYDNFGRLIREALLLSSYAALADIKRRYGDDLFTRLGGKMAFKGWHLAAMEDMGYMDTNTGLINRVARILAKSSSDEIDTEEFRDACYAAGVDPDSFTQSDLDELQRKLNELT